MPFHGLKDLRVLDLSTGIAGAYCTKLMADAGADVVKVETPTGDPLRRWSATGADLGDRDGALFQFLHFSKRSIVADPAATELAELITGSDLVVESAAFEQIDPQHLARRHPNLVVLSITSYGRTGPWAKRPTSELILQAECGSIGSRGLPGGEPFLAGGRITDWVGGTFAAVAALAAVQGARRGGRGGWIDFSLLETMTIATTNYMSVLFQMLGVPPNLHGPIMPTVETPSIEPTADGFVGFCTNTRQQFSDFLLLIERPDLQADEELAQVVGRLTRLAEWEKIVHAWTEQHGTAEIVERASAFRIPVAPVLDGARVRDHEQLVARGVYRSDPDGQFQYPRPPYRIDGEEVPAPARAPHLGEHTGTIEPRRPVVRQTAAEPSLPLAGIRILDCTNWWAGPSATHLLACLGAEVVHVESTQKPDGMRMVGGMLASIHPEWWECSQFFVHANSNKRGVTLHLSDRRGRALLERLLPRVDALVENYSPRVLDGFGLTWDAIRAANPQCIMVRMPAFGLDGPWRDNTGFAQTMEQLSGLAWLTGHRDDHPRIQRGPCDPLAGMHAAFALLVALEERKRRGRGMHVECTMVEGALNAAAEQVLEFTAYGNRMEREGNRAPHAAPQGIYPCLGSEPGSERWLALAIETDAQWNALVDVLGNPGWARSTELASHDGRRRHHDLIDGELRAFCANRKREELVELLISRGVPAGTVVDPRSIHTHPQMVARRFFEAPEHPVVGAIELPTVPFRLTGVERWLRTPAPTMGQHNREILRGWLGLSDDEIEALAVDGIIGDRPAGL
jgi:crotonobetainyl-CoA:carnitine CoA-transferase CaiB-like acyl-CoA transferase